MTEYGEVFEHWPVELVDLDALQEHPENYREHDVGAIIASIERWGVWRPLVVQKSTRYVLVGNGELKALRMMRDAAGRAGHLGGQAPVRWMDIDDDNARAIMLADNWIPSRGRNMPQELLNLMAELREERELFESAGVDDDDFEALTKEVEEDLRPLKLRTYKRKVTCPECGHKFEVAK